jgi:hypothetical protein
MQLPLLQKHLTALFFRLGCYYELRAVAFYNMRVLHTLSLLF